MTIPARSRKRPAVLPKTHTTSTRSAWKSSSSSSVSGRLCVLLAALFCFASFSLLPILVLDRHSGTLPIHSFASTGAAPPTTTTASGGGGSSSRTHDTRPLRVPVSVHNLIGKTEHILAQQVDKIVRHPTPKIPPLTVDAIPEPEQRDPHIDLSSGLPKAIPTHIDELHPDPSDWTTTQPVARGVAGRTLEQTPALVGAQRAHIECDVNVDSLAYWNDPQGTRDATNLLSSSPFAVPTDQTRYITFSPDHGGWNNIRMSMEIIFIIAAVTGRTLVLPPKEPLYLLHHGQGSKHRGFGDFFPLNSAEFQKRVNVISMEEFLARNVVTIPPEQKTAILAAADHCDKRKLSSSSCGPIVDFLNDVGHNPGLSALHSCLVFDQDKYADETGNAQLDPEVQEYVHEVCGPKRDVIYWTAERNEPLLLHFHADEKGYRLLSHFYSMIHFTDPALENQVKRFVRDFLHYHDSIYCAAGKIVKAVQAEAVTRGFAVDPNGAGAYSALHVRRGDLQYKKVKIPAVEWYENTKELWQEREILYVATDERNHTFFDDLAIHHDLRYLDDYWDLAGLQDLDPNYMGMIDTIVASRGRIFAGTWFSTFSGYINRLRGYHGMSMMDSWYSFLPKKTAVHEWKTVDTMVYAYEYPDGWIGIDGDERPTRDAF